MGVTWMAKQSRRRLKAGVSGRVELSFQELLLSGQAEGAGEYLSLSISARGEFIRIQMTTTDARPMTYTAIIPKISKIDFNSLLFLAQ